MKTRIALALAALLAAGCDTPSAIDDYTDAVRLEFSARNNQAGPPNEPELTFTGGDGEIVVEGRLTAANPCHELEADAFGINGVRVELTVRVRQQQQACTAVIGRFEYTARLLDLEPGTYALAVVHEYPGRGRSRQETLVTVR
jgi:hypothetical protein